jgi:RHS repeat-associated protein
VAGVWDGTYLKVYLNGVLDGSTTTGNAPGSGTSSVKIGRNSGGSYFNGLIDEVRVSNAAVYTSNFTPQTHISSTGSTKGLWKFDGQTTADSSTNGNNGTLQGGAVYSNDVPSGDGGGGGGGGGVSQIQWLVPDHLGTPRMIFDQTGNLANMKRHDYLPFGEELFAPAGGRTTGMGYSGGDGVRQQFTLKERDVETGLDYFEARYYSSSQGRFTSIDPREINFESGTKEFLAYLGNPQNWNLYAYVLNSPLVLIDQDGREPNKAQAGTAADIVAIIRKIEKDNPTLTQTEILQRVDGYFRTKPDEAGNVRYVYTKENGWLDMKHFFAAANVAANSSIGEVKTIVGGLLVEIGQTLEGDESAFSYEDLPTNAAGAEFGDEEFKPGGDKLSSQVEKFLEKTLQATLPQFAPNYAALPKEPQPAQGSRSNQSAQGRNDSASANNARNNRRGGTINPPRRRP